MPCEKGFVVWFTGIPGSGKTTLARMLRERLSDMGLCVEHLDGDEVRPWLSPEAGFSREDRLRHLRRVAFVTHLLSRNGVVVLASFVSPYREARDLARELNGDRFVEVYVKCPVEVAVERDPKGLYRKALKGEIKNMTGIQDVYEEPLNPEIVVETDRETHEESLEKILGFLRSRGFIG